MKSGRLRQGKSEVILEINSPGGYCDMGSEIYTILMEYQGKVTAHIMAAASAASVIACAADEVLMSDTAVYMIHNSRGCGSGDYRDLMNASEALEKYNEAIVNAYVRKTGKDREELHAMMDHTTWMSASDTIEHGFADGFLFGNPDESRRKDEESDGVEDSPQADYQAVAAAQPFPIISSEKALELRSIIEMNGLTKKDFDSGKGKEALRELLLQNNSMITDSDIENETGGKKNMDEDKKQMAVQLVLAMSLTEILAAHPQAKKEYEAALETAGAEGVEAGISKENARLRELDAVAANVPADKLHEAKYGEHPMDAKEFVYQLFVEDGSIAAGYMVRALQDAEDAHVDEVACGIKDAKGADDGSDAYASYINSRRGRR